MPAYSAPHKADEEDPGPQRRLAMCQLAVGGEPGLEVCALEIERGGPSYTVDSLRAIDESHPDSELTFIVGADMALTLPTWRDPHALVGLARLAVAEREHGDAGGRHAVLVPLQAERRILDMPTVESLPRWCASACTAASRSRSWSSRRSRLHRRARSVPGGAGHHDDCDDRDDGYNRKAPAAQTRAAAR